MSRLLHKSAPCNMHVIGSRIVLRRAAETNNPGVAEVAGLWTSNPIYGEIGYGRTIAAAHFRLFALWLCLFGLTAGCARYQLGAQTLYNPNIRTIHIPVIRNETWRHEIGVQLTEALQKAVELRTPFKVVADPSADSTLTCRVTTQTKRTVTEARTDEPRDVETMIAMQLTWTDRQGNQLMENRFVPLGEFAFYFIQGSDFVPEGGQSMATAQHRAVEELANQIVNQMEIRW